jgi:hypothetical protein
LRIDPFEFPAPILSLALRRSFAASSQNQFGATSTTVASAIRSRDHPLYPGQARMVTSIYPAKASLQTPLAILSPLSPAWSATPCCTAFSQSPRLPNSVPHTPLSTPLFDLLYMPPLRLAHRSLSIIPPHGHQSQRGHLYWLQRSVQWIAPTNAFLAPQALSLIIPHFPIYG